MTITFNRQTFTESTANDILALRSPASRLDVAVTAQRYLQEQYRAFKPDPSKDSFANWTAFIRKHRAAAKLAIFGPPLEDDALPTVTVEN